MSKADQTLSVECSAWGWGKSAARPRTPQGARAAEGASADSRSTDGQTAVPTSLEALLTFKEVALVLRISPRTVARLVDRREIAHVRIGSRPLIPRSAIEEFLCQRTVPADPQGQKDQAIDAKEITQRTPP